MGLGYPFESDGERHFGSELVRDQRSPCMREDRAATENPFRTGGEHALEERCSIH